jgi:hypothetical protein
MQQYESQWPRLLLEFELVIVRQVWCDRRHRRGPVPACRQLAGCSFPSPETLRLPFRARARLYLHVLRGRLVPRQGVGWLDGRTERACTSSHAAEDPIRGVFQLALPLKDALKTLHSFRRPGENAAICSISGRRPRDHVFSCRSAGIEDGPFASIRHLHDAMCTYINGDLRGQINTEYRALFEDDFGIVFTHCDLHHMNIMVNTDGELLALVDWEQAGWMPSYWEWCRSEYFWFHLHRPS